MHSIPSYAECRVEGYSFSKGKIRNRGSVAFLQQRTVEENLNERRYFIRLTDNSLMTHPSPIEEPPKTLRTIWPGVPGVLTPLAGLESSMRHAWPLSSVTIR